MKPALAAPLAPVTGAAAGIVRRVDLPGGDKAVALTFDLCQTVSPIAGYDGAIVDYLRAEDVAATFFAAGRWLETHKARAEQLAGDRRFLLANHSFAHPDLHAASAGRVQSEILLTEAALAATREAAAKTCPASAPAAPMRLFRFPYGSCTASGVAAANAIGSVVIQWDTVSGDPDGTSARSIVRNVFSTVRPGSIVVMHANGRGTHTAEALHRSFRSSRPRAIAFSPSPTSSGPAARRRHRLLHYAAGRYGGLRRQAGAQRRFAGSPAEEPIRERGCGRAGGGEAAIDVGARRRLEGRLAHAIGVRGHAQAQPVGNAPFPGSCPGTSVTGRRPA